MAELSGAAGAAAVGRTTDEQAAADAVAHPDVCGIAGAPRGSGAQLGEAAEIGLGIDEDGKLDALAHGLRNVDPVPPS